MRFIERIGSAWQALTGKSAPPAGGYSYGWGGGSSWSDAFRFRRAPTPAELIDSYKSLVYACVNLNAHAVARTPLRLYAITKGGQARPRCAVKAVSRKTKWRLGRLDYTAKTMAGAEQVEEVTDHPLLDAVMKVNGDLDHTQLITYTVMSLDIVGAAYWWPCLGKYSLPEEIWALPPHLVYPVFEGGSMVPDAYNFGSIRYDKKDLVRFRRLSAKNPYGQGYGPEQAAIEYARLEDTFVSIQDNLLANGPRPSLIVSHKDPKGAFGTAERQRLEADMERRGRGGRAGGVFVVDGAATVTPISFTPTDLGGLQVSSYDLERIANCFDVPVSMLKTEDVNRANAEAGLEQHGRNAVEPRCRLIASTLTRWTHSLDATRSRSWDRLFWAFDPVVNEDKQAEAELHRTYLDLGVLSRNEVRLDIGYEPADGGDAILVPGGLARLSDVASEPQHGAGSVEEDRSENDQDDDHEDDVASEAEETAETEDGEDQKVLQRWLRRMSRAIESRLLSPRFPRSPNPGSTPKFNPNHNPNGQFAPGHGGTFRNGKHSQIRCKVKDHESHHGVMSAWTKAHFPGYSASRAPAVLMPKANHRETCRLYQSWRKTMTRKMGGTFDWNHVSEKEIRKLSVRMFEVARVPEANRRQYWADFRKMKVALTRTPKQFRREGPAVEEQTMAKKPKILTAAEMKESYGDFYDLGPPKVKFDLQEVPEKLRPLAPYVEFWGIFSDWDEDGNPQIDRDELVESAPVEVRRNLVAVLNFFEEDLNDWLGSDDPSLDTESDTYVAFTGLRMAGDYASAMD